jgi:hypothetical protein
MKRSTAFVLLMTLGLWLGLGHSKAVAQQQTDQTGLSVSPAIFELIVEPGEAQQKTFYIRNITDTAVPVRVSTEELAPTEEQIDKSLSNSFNASSWINLSEQNHILNNKESRPITATVQVPKTAEPGGHYATILLEPLVPAVAVSGQSGSQAAAKVGVLVFITVKGEARHQLTTHSSPGISFLQTLAHISIDAAIANTGTVHELPTAKVIVRNIFGGIEAELPIQPRVVLPNTIKTTSLQWQAPFLFGIYSAQIEGVYGSSQTPLQSDKKVFIVLQWFPLVLLSVLLVAGFMYTRKTYKRWPQAFRALLGKTPNNSDPPQSRSGKKRT